MRLIFANTISHKRAVLFSFALEFTESLLDILFYPKCMIGPIRLGLREKFQNKGSQMAGKRFLEINVCKYSVRGESFCSSLNQNLQKVYYELKFHSSEDCPFVFLIGMRSNFRVYNS